VDDSDAVRQALCSLLRAHVEFEIVCESVNGWAAISKTADLQPDVIPLDINLPDLNGLEVARQMKTVSPSAETLLLSEHGLLPMVKEGLRGGRTRLGVAVRRSRRVGDCDSAGPLRKSNTLALDAGGRIRRKSLAVVNKWEAIQRRVHLKHEPNSDTVSICTVGSN